MDRNNLSLQDTFEKLLTFLDEMFKSNFAGKQNDTWFAMVFDHYYPEFYKSLHENESTRWVFAKWTQESLEWDKVSNWNHVNIKIMIN